MPITVTGYPPRWASTTTDVSASAIAAHRSSIAWSLSTTDAMTARMSNGFLRSLFVSSAKISPTVVNGLSGWLCG